MLFNSLQFAIYFPCVVALFFLLPPKWKTLWLLVASCAFYMAFIPAYILILFITILIDYFAGIYIERSSGRPRKILLWVSIASTCVVLAVFKYLDFFLTSFTTASGWLGWQLPDLVTGIILPIGLSFHTFQSLSYVVEVYRGEQKAESDFIAYATYVMFFPQLVAGPIERPQNMLHQFHERHRFDYDNVTAGLRRMAWGFFKKLVVADRLALYVSDVYGSPRDYNGLQLIIATVFFAYQIYCDFSGYSDIAIGSARVMGFTLMENFRTPYDSRSISEFWRRWHISLSTWFKDYVYLPLGGSRASMSRHSLNLLITFAISGLWHGAAWTFVLWGALNGIYLVVGAYTKDARDRAFATLGISPDGLIRGIAKRVSTFVLICLAWVLFRAASIEDAAYILTHFTSNWDGTIRTPHFLLRQMPVAIGALLILEFGQHWQGQWTIVSQVTARARAILPVRWAAYAAFVLAVIMFGVYQETEFIYFQF